MRVHHPLQQGLRQRTNLFGQSKKVQRASASSITTRIKTIIRLFYSPLEVVRVHHPLQQGLRPFIHFIGIKNFFGGASASSITTRIKTSLQPR